MGFDKPDLGFVVHLGRARRRRSPTTSRSAGPGAASSGPRWSCCPGTEDRDIWAYFASLAFPPEQLVRQTLAALVARRAAVDRGARDRASTCRRTPPGDDAQGARRRRRGAAGQGRLDRRPARPWAYDARALQRGSPSARVARAAGDARLPRDHRVPDGVPAPRSSTTRPRRRAAAATTAPARCGARRSRRPTPKPPASASPGPGSRSSRGGSGRRGWPGSRVPVSGRIPADEQAGARPRARAAVRHRLGHAAA